MKPIKLLVVAFLAMICLSSRVQAQDDESLVRSMEKYWTAVNYIKNNYVDTVNLDALIEESVQELMAKLDPHSFYIPKEDLAQTNEPLEGSFDGVGIEFAIIGDTLTVQSVIAGGPCESVGVLAGDKIVSIDGENVAGCGLSNDGVRNRLRGPRGTKVDLSILRRADSLNFLVTRDKVPLNSIDAAYSPEPGVIYIKLSRFAQNSAQEFLEAMGMLGRRPEGVIIDLRSNGGGYMHIATLLASMFLESGQRILFTEGINSPSHEEVAGRMGLYRTGPLVVLVDENSASSSEILAGALQDWDRAVVIGRRTFGKGLVQQEFPLLDGSVMRLTVARYHTPSGRVVQSPYEKGNSAAYYRQFMERYQRGEHVSRDSISLPDSLKFKTLKLGRTVYGGGGIMPDIFVPSDTTGINSYLAAMIRRGLMTDYANEYCDRNRDKVTYEDFDKFYAAYPSLEPEILRGLYDYCSSHGLDSDEGQRNACESLVKTRIKALVAKASFGMTGYFRVVNLEEDPDFQKALEVVREWRSKKQPSIFREH